MGDVHGLNAALADQSIGHIYLEGGTYSLTSQLSISRDLTLEAATPGTVFLDGQDSTQILHISSGTVELNGLGITRGYSSVPVSASREHFRKACGISQTLLAFQDIFRHVSPPVWRYVVRRVIRFVMFCAACESGALQLAAPGPIPIAPPMETPRLNDRRMCRPL